jgi:hypothetical protein
MSAAPGSGLASRVSGLRSQGLSFSRDGLDITLDVPDTRDVKEIFGTMATTMETQDGQLQGLGKELEESAQRNKREQKDIMDWATHKFEEMQKENDALREKLDKTKSEFKNFTFNIQGFDDEATVRPKTASPTEAEAVVAEPELEKQDSGFAMFSTEQGAEPDLLTGKEEEAEEEVEEVGPLGPSLQGPGSQSFAFSERPSPLDSRSPSKRFGRRQMSTEMLTPERSAFLRGLWRKAINAVMVKNRTIKLAFGFTKTRVKKAESLMARMERIEDKMFDLPISMIRDVEYELGTVNRELTKEIDKCEQAVSERSLEGVTLAITSVRGDVSSLGGALRDLDKMVEERTGDQGDKLKAMAAVAGRVAEAEQLQAGGLRKKVKNLMSQMKSLSGLYEAANALVYGLMARNAIVAESSSEESIVQLLKLDTQIRQARESVLSIQGASAVLGKLVSNLKDDILSSRSGPDASIDADDRDDLVGACDHITGVIAKVEVGVKNAQDFCRQHDEHLAERWMGFASVIQAAKSTASLSNKLKTLQLDLEEKPSQQQLQDAMEASATDITPISNQITELRDIIAQQRSDLEETKGRVVELQDKLQLTNAAMQASKTNSNSLSASLSRPQSAHQSALPPTQAASQGAAPPQDGGGGEGGADLSANLQPMIRDIIDAYMKSWTEDNMPLEERSKEWVDNQQDDDSWFQANVQSDEPEEPVPAPVPAPAETEAARPASAGADHVPVLEDYPPAEDAAAASRASSRPASGSLAGARAASPEPEHPAPAAAPDDESDSRPASRGLSRGASRPSSKPVSRQGSMSDGRPEPTSMAGALRPSSGSRRRPSDRPRSAHGDSESVLRMREELKEVSNKLEAMYINKMDAATAQSILQGKADKVTLKSKADSLALEGIEAAIGRVHGEVGDLRSLHSDSLRVAKAQMAEKLDKALKSLLASERDSSRGVSLAATKSLCMSCGRTALAKTNAMPSSPRGYLPQLNRASSPGPDVLRGGFKMPVSAPSGSTVRNGKTSLSHDSGLHGVTPPHSAGAHGRQGHQGHQGRKQGQGQGQHPLFSRSLSTTLYDKDAVQQSFNDDFSTELPPPLSAPGRGSSGGGGGSGGGGSGNLMQLLPDIPIVAMPVGVNQARPMYRKGFPATKSRPPVSSAPSLAPRRITCRCCALLSF